ncbi:MAG: hypothetical protein JSU86_03980 [Phycisphaerales bacterium]|nr:MAG: hypothetical protein JSU86_03980 [Phycisphaerales bacterium]
MSSRNPKISAAFSARLAKLAPEQKLRVIVMLANGPSRKSSGRRLTREQRRRAMEKTQATADGALRAVDRILERFDGKRLAKRADALGCVAVETTAAGIRALADAPEVESILEDQQIGLLHRPAK